MQVKASPQYDTVINVCMRNELVYFTFNLIPQYCTAHPVLRIITRNWQQNIMAAFLAGKLVREKNGRFGKAWLGKRGGNLWQRRKRQLCENNVSFSNMAEHSQSKGNLNRCDGPFLLNEHGDLYFLLHKNIVNIILLNLEKKIVGRKKRYSRKRAQNHYSNMQIMTKKTTTLRMLYICVVLNCVIRPQILYDVVLYARHFLPVKFFATCYFDKVRFELLQNLT